MLHARRRSPFLLASMIAVLAGVFPVSAHAQLGGPLPGLRPSENRAFNTGHSQFHRDWGMKEGAGVVFTDGGCRRCQVSGANGAESA